MNINEYKKSPVSLKFACPRIFMHLSEHVPTLREEELLKWYIKAG